MKRITSFLITSLLILSLALPCSAADKYTEKGDIATIDVYAKCISTVQHPSVPVHDGTAEIITADGYEVYVSEVSDNAIALKVVSIPSVEKEAWAWFAKCIGDGKSVSEIFDIYFEDTDGNRINANGTKIRISKVPSSTTVISVTTSGKSTELSSESSGDDITFLTAGSHYYVLVRSVEETTGTRYKITVEETSGGIIVVSEPEPVAGQIVTIGAIPDAGNIVNTIFVCDAKGQPMTVTDNGDGTYSYIQPESDVRIKAVFEQKSNAKSYLQLLSVAIIVLCILGVCFIIKRRRKQH